MTDFKKELEETGFVVFTCRGRSMLPMIRQDRDVVVIKSKRDGFGKNDAVLFVRDNGQYVLHRIRKVFDGEYFIIGDNCVKGERVPREKIIGVLTEIRKDGRKISVTDGKYKLFVFFLPVRRTFLFVREKALCVASKIYHLVKK